VELPDRGVTAIRVDSDHPVRVAPLAGADIICTLTKAREPILLGGAVDSGWPLTVVGSSIAATARSQQRRPS